MCIRDSNGDDAFVRAEEDSSVGHENRAPVVPAKGTTKEKKRARGRNSSMKRYLRKKRQNVVDANTIALREKYQREKARRREEQEPAPVKEPSALDVFARNRGPRR